MTSGNGKILRIAAVGMFDGVHRGHAFLLDTLSTEARKRGMKPLVLTFATHPRQILNPESAPSLLSSPRQRSRYIADRFGIETVILDLNRDDLAMTATEFLKKIKDEYGVATLLMGYDNHIGRDRRNGSELAAAGSPVIVAPPCPDIEASSSAVRKAIADGDIKLANLLLGHSYTIEGTVGSGRQLGRQIGFPTANIIPDEPSQLLPPDGAYIVDTIIDGKRRRGIANIGLRPTVEGTNRTFEVHILDFSGDLYGQQIKVEILSWLRNERRFPTLIDLRQQLVADADAARRFSL